jgi:hypothetical protein
MHVVRAVMRRWVLMSNARRRMRRVDHVVRRAWVDHERRANVALDRDERRRRSVPVCARVTGGGVRAMAVRSVLMPLVGRMGVPRLKSVQHPRNFLDHLLGVDQRCGRGCGCCLLGVADCPSVRVRPPDVPSGMRRVRVPVVLPVSVGVTVRDVTVRDVTVRSVTVRSVTVRSVTVRMAIRVPVRVTVGVSGEVPVAVVARVRTGRARGQKKERTGRRRHAENRRATGQIR